MTHSLRRAPFAVASLLAVAAVSACAGSSPPPPKTAAYPDNGSAAPSSETMGTEASDSEASAAVSSADPTADPSDGTDESPAAASPSEGPEPRQILYKVTPEGLVVEVEGLELVPHAKPVRMRGGWGVEISVEATALDDRMHRLLTPEHGPLAFAADITRKGKTERFTDERQGDDEMFITPGDSQTLTRRFPGEGLAPLWWGNELTLEAGLWGLAADADRRRQVRKLFVVKMVAGNKPQPVITPPR